MAEDLDDGEFWLPPMFLSDHDFPGCELTRPSSDTSESLVWSTDEDDYLFQLNRRLAHSSLSDDCWKLDNNKWASSTSPRSTLCNGYTQVSALTPHFRPPTRPSPAFIPPNNSNPGFYMNHPVSYGQLQVNQFPPLKQRQVRKQQQQQGNLRRGQQQMSPHYIGRHASNGRPLPLSPSSWPTLQQSGQPQPQQRRPGWGMRAVFFQNPAMKRQCSGTGVFLPRPVGTPTQTLNKPAACSPVLLPDRVVQALNHNLKAMDASAAQLHNRSNSNSAAISSSDYAVKYQNRVLMAETQAQQRWNAAAIRPQAAPISNDVELPQEWTY